MRTWLSEHHPDTIDASTKELLIPLPKDAILGFFGHICSPAHACDRDGVDSKDSPSVPLSASCVWGYRSALVDVYHSKLLELDQPVDTELRRVLDGYEKLFIGGDNKNRFGRLLRRVIDDLTEEEIGVLCCSPNDIGTHSLRKGSSSYALGQVNGPTPVSVYLRMGQSLGKLKDRYIHFGEGRISFVAE
eukprot:jgi/Phyca11/103475/e_gw1.8.808.1